MSESLQLAVEGLKSSLLGQELSHEQLCTLAGCTGRLVLTAGEILIREGDKDHRLFVVARGAFEASRPGGRDSVSFVQLGPGDIVGEVGFLEGLARTATVRAAAESVVYTLERAEFERLLDQHPRVACGVLRALLRSVHRVVLRLTEKNVDLIGYIYS